MSYKIELFHYSCTTEYKSKSCFYLDNEISLEAPALYKMVHDWHFNSATKHLGLLLCFHNYCEWLVKGVLHLMVMTFYVN